MKSVIDSIKRIWTLIQPFSVMVIVFGWALYANYFINGNQDYIAYGIFSLTIVLLGLIRVDLLDLMVISALFSLLYIWQGNLTDSLKNALISWFIFYMGKLIGKVACREKKVYVVIWMIIASVIFAIRGLLNYSWLLTNTYFTWWPMWGFSTWEIPRTQHEFFLIIPSTMLAFWILYIRKNTLSILGAISSILMMVTSMFGHGRLGTCATVVVCVSIGALSFFEKDRTVNLKKTVRVILGILSVLLVLIVARKCILMVLQNTTTDDANAILYNLGGFGFWNRDGGIFRNVRFMLWVEALRQIFSNPFGPFDLPLDVRGTGVIDWYAHNTWLDAGRFGGIIPFLLFSALIIFIFVCLYKLWRQEKSIEKYAIISPFIGMTLYNMFEPVVIANYNFWNVEVFLGGVIVGWWYAIKRTD